MADTFLTGVEIKNVRHLKNISIPLSTEKRKHLILTGKNGSGKTSVLESLRQNLGDIVCDNFKSQSEIDQQIEISTKMWLQTYEKILLGWTDGVIAECDYVALHEKYGNNQFIIAYYKAERFSQSEISDTIERVELKDQYKIYETPGVKLLKYMVSLKATQAFAQQQGIKQRAAEIEAWFTRFQGIMQRVFQDPTLKLEFDIETFKFSILQQGHEPFDFNTMSSGYSAVFEIINDLTMRTEKKGTNIEGIVLIDEMEAHLHLELQKVIFPLLTELFPNLQFIISTHSPFILNSIENAVIFDLENKTLVSNGLANLPYEGIVEGYFEADRLSEDLRNKFERFKELVAKQERTDEEYAEIMELEVALDEIPDYLALELTTEYRRLKLELDNQE